MQSQKFEIVDHVSYVSGYAKEVLKNHCGSVCNEELFQQLETMCRDYVKKRVSDYSLMLEERKEKANVAETLIWRIQHYYNYAAHKQSLKMRFTKKEYDEGMSRLSQAEQEKVTQWLTDNGGYDKFIFQQGFDH